MAAFFGAFCMLSISYLKLLLQDNLAVVFDASSVIAIYSYCIIATRVVKILGNAITGTSGMHGAKYSFLSLLLALGGVFAASCGLAGVLLSGMPAIVVTAAGLLGIYYVFDPMSDVQSFLSIEHLNAGQSITAIYIRGLLRELVSAVVSTLITVVLAANSYLGAMVLLVVMSLMVFVFGLIGKRYHNLQSGDYARNWPIESIRINDSLVVSAAILMIHYGVVQSYEFNPTVLANRVEQVEHIGSHYPLFRYVGKQPYTFERLYESFCNGEPSAVRGYRNGEYKWYPVLYVDEDDGVMAGYGEGPLFIEDFEDIKERCVFSLRPKLQLWAGL
ncbi:MAG: hypothetical protein Q4A01_06450 [Coriobacteriales bacterium]|nr:hypothetical protein [Coriobacteriales bacterium]